MKNELENTKAVDRLPAAYMKIAELKMRVSELEEIIKKQVKAYEELEEYVQNGGYI